ncbi:hypothetical protein M9H77_06389 [Catharanthus roseus]|uniref:Uncharacterized protein n=1 Tax=Catharanthus roseus TaxID=4058 RepID=A0ACC0BS07_CATRO|nr:hypothetical protein M9H77_06389 [Catharanthus roseus]
MESQEGLETKLGLKANQSVAWFGQRYGECGRYEIECSLPSCVRTPHVDSSISYVEATKEKSVTLGFALVSFGTCSLVPRGTHTPYPAAVNPVERSGISHTRCVTLDDESEDGKSYDLSIKDAPLTVPMDEFQTKMRVTFEQLCITQDIHRHIRVHPLIARR